MKTLEELANEGELFTSFESELIKQQLYDVIKDAAIAARVGRQLVNVVNLKAGSSLDFVLADKNSIAFRQVAEGSEIPLDNETYTKINVEPNKWGTRVVISSEMKEDSNWDVVKRNLVQAGRYAGLKEDSIIFTALIAGVNASNAFNSAGTTLGIDDITKARKLVNANDFAANKLVIHPTQTYELQNLDTFVEADKVGNRETWEKGFVGKIFGLDVIESTSQTENIALVMDTRESGVLVVRRPLTMKTYEIPERDAVGLALTMRENAGVMRDTAFAKITVV